MGKRQERAISVEATVWGLLALAGACRPNCDAGPVAEQVAAHVSVAPFRSGHDFQELGQALAESLTVRLSRLPGLRAAVGESEPGPAFRVEGDLTVRAARLAITLRLFGPDSAEPLWSGTYWRKDSLDTGSVTDLAGGLAEAIYGHMARAPVQTWRRRP